MSSNLLITVFFSCLEDSSFIAESEREHSTQHRYGASRSTPRNKNNLSRVQVPKGNFYISSPFKQGPEKDTKGPIMVGQCDLRVLFHSAVCSFFCSFILSSIHSFIHSFLQSFIHWFILSFVHSLIYLFFRPFNYPFFCSFVKFRWP